MVGRQVRAEALATPFRDRVQRRVLQQLRRRFDDRPCRLALRKGLALLIYLAEA
jgi:hypothetical protein